MKNKLFIFLVTTIICYSIILSANANINAKEKKPKLSSSKITMDVGAQKTLKLKNIQKNSKVTWKSSNKKIVKVSKKGKLIAKNSGKVTIKATTKQNGRKYVMKCRVIVKKVIKNTKTPNNGSITISLPLYGKKNTLFDQIAPNKVAQIDYWLNNNHYVVKNCNKITALLGYMSLLEVTPIENPMVDGGFILDLYIPTDSNQHISLGFLEDKFCINGQFYKIENSTLGITTVIQLLLAS